MTLSLRDLSCYAAQGVLYAGFMLLVAYLTVSPAHTYLPEGHAKVTLSFAHTSDRKGECRELTEEEREDLPPTRRRAEDCPRERVPVDVRVLANGKVLYDARVPPSGLRGGGRVYVYETFILPAGDHELTLKLRDQYQAEDYNVVQHRTLDLQAHQSVVIDYSRRRGGFLLRHGEAEGNPES